MIRAPIAAGRFYPADADELATTVDALVGTRTTDATLAAIIAPHAGYPYSGATAGRAFRLLPDVPRVALLGPSHFVALTGVAVSAADTWRTPLGEVRVSTRLREAALATGARLDETPHAADHALEVELPFLQRCCRDDLEILPLAVGRASAGEVANVIRALDALVVVSSDLSHYLDEASARERDGRTAEAIVTLDTDRIGDRDACGAAALRGLVEHAGRAGLTAELLDLRTSADAGSPPEQVVGYGAFAFRA